MKAYFPCKIKSTFAGATLSLCDTKIFFTFSVCSLFWSRQFAINTEGEQEAGSSLLSFGQKRGKRDVTGKVTRFKFCEL